MAKVLLAWPEINSFPESCRFPHKLLNIWRATQKEIDDFIDRTNWIIEWQYDLFFPRWIKRFIELDISDKALEKLCKMEYDEFWNIVSAILLKLDTTLEEVDKILGIKEENSLEEFPESLAA